LLPYEDWAEAAMKQVMIRALAHVVANGLPGDHHFYVTFQTGHPGVVMPQRLRSQYPQEMTIILQHQFWDLKVDEEARLLSVGLSFGGIPTSLVVPFGAIIAFADPHVRYGMRFRPEQAPEPEAKPAEQAPARPVALAPVPAAESDEKAAEQPQVVSLDAFRRRGQPKP
ncbi:MAG: SspB family protein, partial [Trebonia sp.]